MVDGDDLKPKMGSDKFVPRPTDTPRYASVPNGPVTAMTKQVAGGIGPTRGATAPARRAAIYRPKNSYQEK